MKLYLFIFTCFIFSYSNAQNDASAKGKIIYEIYANLGQPVSEQWILYFKEKRSIFIQDETFKPFDKDIPSNGETIELKTDEVTPHIIVDFAKDSIYSQGMVFVKSYYVADKIYTPKWQIIKEFKTIGSHKCQKATTVFRGRNYTAWFCEKIPVNFGPWKFSGLPGLILEVHDDMNVFKIKALSVEISSALNYDFSFQNIPRYGKQLSLKEYVVLKDNQSEEILQYILSKQDRNVDIEITSEPRKRTGFELKYEWEQDEKK